MSRHSARGRLGRGLAALAAAGMATLVLAGAVAVPSHAAEETSINAISLSWDGVGYAATTTETFFGTPVTVPGDTATRTLHVRNDGPTDGMLRVTIANVELLGPDALDLKDGVDQGNFYDDVLVSWDSGEASLSALDEQGSTEVLAVSLARGEAVPITIGYEFPVDATSGSRANVDARQASFDVKLELSGDLPAPPSPPAKLPSTGAPAGLAWYALAGGILLGLGALVARDARRRAGATPGR